METIIKTGTMTIGNQIFVLVPYEEFERMKEVLEGKEMPAATVAAPSCGMALEYPDIADLRDRPKNRMSQRLYDILSSKGIRNISEVQNTTRWDWIRTKGVGERTFDELEYWMGHFNLEFKSEEQDDLES